MPIRTYSQVFSANGTWLAPWNLAFAPAVYCTGESATAGTSSHGVRSGPGSGGGAVGGEPLLGGVAPGTVLTVTVPQGSTGLQTTVTGGAVTVAANPGLAPVTTTGGLGGTAGANTVAFAGGNGSNAISGASVSGGGGGGSAGAGGAGGSTATAAGGTAGAGLAGGLAALAGAVGAAGGTSLNPGNNGIAPGSGASGGGSGGSINHAGGAGAPGQAVIIWSVFDLPGSAHPAPTGRRGQLAVVLAPFPAPAPPSTPTAPTIRPGTVPPRPGRRGRLASVLAPFPPAVPSTPTAPTIRPARVPPRPGRRGRLVVVLAPFPPPAPPPISHVQITPGDILKPWRKRPYPRIGPPTVDIEAVLRPTLAGLDTPSDPAGALERGGVQRDAPAPLERAAGAVSDTVADLTRRAAGRVRTGGALEDAAVIDGMLYWQQNRNRRRDRQ